MGLKWANELECMRLKPDQTQLGLEYINLNQPGHISHFRTRPIVVALGGLPNLTILFVICGPNPSFILNDDLRYMG